jgi:L-malate glycosyltransferase
MNDVLRLGLKDRVIVRENVRYVEDYLQTADIGLFTSESESFCLSILEAMNFACPSIAPRVGGIPEVIEDNRTGLLVPFGDPEKTARAVETLVQDKKLRERLGRAALARARKQFSAGVVVSRYETLYRRICAKFESKG